MFVATLPSAKSARATGGDECPTPSPVGPLRSLIAAAEYDLAIPRPEVLPGFGDRPVTSAELETYVRMVDAVSDRVVTGSVAHTAQGRDVPFALIGSADSLANLDAIALGHRQLRDPRATARAEAAAVARNNPAIVWYVANMHPLETAGGDAALQLLYDLVARNDAEAAAIRANLVIGIVPTLNPDGRDGAHIRGNSYGIDLNRDFFTLSQPETRGLIDLLQEYPPAVLIDAHEMGTSGFFAAPSANPVFHESPDVMLRWIDEVFGPELRAEFDSRRIPDPLMITPDDARDWWLTGPRGGTVYDLFHQGTLDAVATSAFNAAGILYEKGIKDPPRQRMQEVFVAAWTHLRAAAAHKAPLLESYYDSHVKAMVDGRAGDLEPNDLYPDHCDTEPSAETEVRQPVPDLRVRHYFIRDDHRPAAVAGLLHRLLLFNVEVYRLQQDLVVTDLRRHGRPSSGDGVIPAGSYWIPMAQPQKRWVQALLGEDTYPSVPIPQDNEWLGSAWSQPLLLNLDASFTGDDVRPIATKVSARPRGRIAGPSDEAMSFSFPGDTGTAVAAARELAAEGFAVRRVAAQQGAGPAPSGAFIVDAAPGVVDRLRTVAERLGTTIHAHPRPLEGNAFTPRRIALFRPAGMTNGHTECACITDGDPYLAMRFLLDHIWQMPYTQVTAADVAGGQLSNYDVFVVSGGAATELKPVVTNVKRWVEAGGIFVGTGAARNGTSLGGTALATDDASDVPLSRARQSRPKLRYTGNLVRAEVNDDHPLAAGAGGWVYSYVRHEEPLLKPGNRNDAIVRYPEREREFHYSGYIGHSRDERQAAFKELRRNAVLTDEASGRGRVVLFSGDPNFRVMTEGTQLLLANALAYQRLP